MSGGRTLFLALLVFVLACYHPGYTPTPASASGQIPDSGAETEVLAEGVAAITGAVDVARDQALNDALRKAVEQGVGTFINSETRVENFQLLTDRIYSQSSGYVASYRVLSSSREGDLYRVVVRAQVKLDKILDDLQAIGILVSEQGRPRVMVVVRRVMHQAGTGEERLSEDPIETLVASAFVEKGFEVVDRATVEQNLDRERLRRLLEGDNQAAREIGLPSGAEIAILGTVSETTTRRQVPYTQQDRIFHTVHLNLRAINLNTGAVLGTSALSSEAPFSAEAARSRAADSASRVLIAHILDRWSRRQNVTVIYARNADYQKVELLKSEIRGQVRGVRAVITRELAGRSAVVEVVSSTGTPEVIEQLGARRFGVRVQIEGVSGNRVDIRFLD